MKKIIMLSIALIGTFLLVACGSSSASLESHTGAIHKQGMTQEKVHDIIKKTCEENGWLVTEFKVNTILVEKFDGDNAKSLEIKFDKHFFDVTPNNSDLIDAIEEALKK